MARREPTPERPDNTLTALGFIAALAVIAACVAAFQPWS